MLSRFHQTPGSVGSSFDAVIEKRGQNSGNERAPPMTAVRLTHAPGVVCICTADRLGAGHLAGDLQCNPDLFSRSVIVVLNLSDGVNCMLVFVG